MSDNLSRLSWKQCALVLILLSHAVFGSPIISTANSVYKSLEPVSQADISSLESLHDLLEEDIFGSALDERSDRKKRFLYDTLKKTKPAKLLTLGAASSGIVKDAVKDAAKKVGKSVLKSAVKFGIKAIIFKFLLSKINQVLGFKTHLLNNVENKNREQNSQVLGNGDGSVADSNINTTTEFPSTST